MRFTLLDRIVELEPGVRIKAVKNLSMAEEYLADHFPHFPVMPGVLMLEAMTQAGAWLVRATEGFAHSMVVLREASNLRFGQFLEPGQTMTVTAEIAAHDEAFTKLKAMGEVDGRTTVSARLVLARYNLVDLHPEYAATDLSMLSDLKDLFVTLHAPTRTSAASATHD
ncbi:MAG: 3-hydroxyacyl-ACP dehydratase FabZ family protein [Planctomycetota bacterium]